MMALTASLTVIAENNIKVAITTSQKMITLTKATFLAYLLPPLACQYLMGVLVQLEGTRMYRLALLPILVWLAWRATWVDMSRGDESNVQANTSFVVFMCLVLTRSAVWAFARTRYQRLGEGNGSSVTPSTDRQNSGSDLDYENVYAACWNTWDLMVNTRGIGWNWPRGLIVPKSTLVDPDSHVALFVLRSATSAALNAFSFDACIQLIRSLSPDTFGSARGGSLFDGTLPPVLEYARAVYVSALAGAWAYFAVQYTYQLFAIVGVIAFRQRPSQWPPLFDAPWRSRSLSELWGRRFHQLLRDTVLNLGARPLVYVCGCIGPVAGTVKVGQLAGLIGAFFISGLIHGGELWLSEIGRLGNGGPHAFVVVVGFWVMNGVGVVIERVWARRTRIGTPSQSSSGGARRPVDLENEPVTVGIGEVLRSWAWIFGWLMLWGVPTVNEYAKAGRFGVVKLPGGLEPSLAVVWAARKLWESIFTKI